MATKETAVKFCFPVKELSNQRLRLVPFNAAKHASAYFEATRANPELYAHQALGPFGSADEFVKKFLHVLVDPNPAMLLWAVLDKGTSNDTREERLAGILAYMSSSRVDMSTEIGYVITFPAFQRTYVTTNAVGLLLQYALDSPDEGGLGLRRVQWQTSAANAASIRVAERMGFRKEGLLRWHRVFAKGLVKGKVGNGKPMPRSGQEADIGRDTTVFGLCWDDWASGSRGHVQKLMDRR